jgi:hypothetical protein
MRMKYLGSDRYLLKQRCFLSTYSRMNETEGERATDLEKQNIACDYKRCLDW